MSTDEWAKFLAFVAFPACVMFPLLYGTTAPWWRSWSGRAIIISKVGLAGLVGSAVLFYWRGNRDYPFHAQLVLGSFALITAGTYLYLFAFAREQYIKRNHPALSERCPEEKP